MYIIVLSETEKGLLERYVRTSPLETVRLRAHCLLMRDLRVKIEDIARLVFRSVRTVTRWIEEFSERRIASLFSGTIENHNASKLTKEQREEIKRVVGETPDEYGIPKEFWDVPKLKEYLSAEFGVVYESKQSYHYLLKFAGLSFKYPDKRNPRRDEEAIKRRVVEIREEIAPMLKDERWMVFTSDETRIQLEAEIRKAWLVRGRRTIVKTERTKEHQNYLGFLDQKNGACQVYEISRGNQREMIRVMRQLVKKYPDKKICIIWDNAKCHKGKMLREELKKGKRLEKIHLINFSPYAPDTNPIEHVWNYGKEKIKNRSNQLFEDIKQTFLENITNRQFIYQI